MYILTVQPVEATGINRKEGRLGEARNMFLPFLSSFKPKGNLELNGLCLKKRPTEGQHAVKIRPKRALNGISALQNPSLQLFSGVCSI